MNWLSRHQTRPMPLGNGAKIPRFGSQKWLLLFGLLFLAVVVARLLLLYSKFYFFSDDFLNFIIAQDMGLTAGYLARDVFGQFVPLYRLGINIYYHVAGVRFWLFETASIVCCLTTLAILLAQARTRAVSLAIVIPVLSWAAFAPVFVDTDQWLAAALSILPACVFGAAALWLSQDSGSTWAIERRTAVGILYAIALLFYPKVLFLIILVMAVRVYDRLYRNDVPTLARALLAGFIDVAPLAGLAVVYIAVTRVLHLQSGAQEPTVSQLTEYVFVAFKEGFLNGTLGLDNPIFTRHAVSFSAFLLSLVLLTAWRVRAAVLSIGFLSWFILSSAVIGINRRIPFGLENAHLGHYYCDALIYMLMLALAALKDTRQYDSPIGSTKRVIPVVCAFTVLMAVHLIRAGERWPRTWFVEYANVQYFTVNVRNSLAQVGRETVINDGPRAKLHHAWLDGSLEQLLQIRIHFPRQV